ncbi:MAG: hypothetical protein HY300_18360 [Verrucomicrobia bacterium]|nr:hypothetical protein [Verrucomicrobiota bacterium]
MSLNATSLSSQAHRVLRFASGAQLLLLAVAACRNAHQLNTDAVAYLRLAHYYAHGQIELAVTGYWSPLLPWLLAPLLKLGLAPLVAARLVMALSAVVFFWGCLAVFRAFRMPEKAYVLGAWLAVLASVFWSVRNISPDLLAAGLIASAVAAMTEERWLNERSAAIFAGFLWALAYLAKAVALPLALIVGGALAALVAFTKTEQRERAFHQFGITLIAAIVVALPWIATISLKYGRPTFSTTARIAHAVAGPADRARYHPALQTLHQPEPGRLAAWEDPSRMPYEFWSPLDSAENFNHQLGVIANNLGSELSMLGGISPSGLVKAAQRPGAQTFARALPGFDFCWLGVIALAACMCAPRPWRETLVRDRWRWAVVPCAGLMAIYLPFFLQREDQRYFYGLLPFVWVAVAGAVSWWAQRQGTEAAAFESRVMQRAFASFVLLALLWCAASLNGLPNYASEFAHELAAKMRAAKLQGPIAGSALIQGGRAGFYMAFLLGERWLGDEPGATPERFHKSGAKFVVVIRGSPQADALARAAGFRDLDMKLFGNMDEAGSFLLRVFEVVPPEAGPRLR